MTFLEKLKQEHPEIPEEAIEEIINDSCPEDWNYEDESECTRNVLGKPCTKCWNREMPSKVQQVNVEPSCDDVKAAYEQGLNDASDAVIELVNLSAEELESVFECSSHEFVIENISMKNIIAKLKAHEESQKIQVGDVLECTVDGDLYLVVTMENDSTYPFGVIELKSMRVAKVTGDSKYYKKTGRHKDIQSIFRMIEDEDEVFAISEHETIKYLEGHGFISDEVKDICIDAIEKQIAKKPIDNDLCTCPNCHTYNEVIKKRRNTVEHDVVYCWHCGRALEVTRLGE